MRMTARRGAIGVALVATWALASCTLGLDLGREQCASAKDCTALGLDGATCVEGVCEPAESTTSSSSSSAEASSSSTGTPDPEWGCLGSFVQPMPGPGEMLQHSYRFELAVGVPGTPPKDLTVKLCNKLDIDCAGPLSMPVPDAAGAITIDTAPSFDGYLVAESSETLPAIVFMQKPVIIPQSQKVVRMASAAVMHALVDGVGATLDETKGVALVLTSNCSDQRTAGVQISSPNVDATSVTFYFRGALPSLEATETDAQGAAGFINLPVGFVDVKAIRGATGQTIGEGSFRARPGVISYLPIGPTQQVQ